MAPELATGRRWAAEENASGVTKYKRNSSDRCVYKIRNVASVGLVKRSRQGWAVIQRMSPRGPLAAAARRRYLLWSHGVGHQRFCACPERQPWRWSCRKPRLVPEPHTAGHRLPLLQRLDLQYRGRLPADARLPSMRRPLVRPVRRTVGAIPVRVVLKQLAPDGHSHICASQSGLIYCFLDGIPKI